MPVPMSWMGGVIMSMSLARKRRERQEREREERAREEKEREKREEENRTKGRYDW